ncbi:hypothetical protein [Legionella antarctica]
MSRQAQKTQEWQMEYFWKLDRLGDQSFLSPGKIKRQDT